MKKYTYIIAVLSIIGLASCEDAIEVDNGFEASQIVVDAWITNEVKPQVIQITESQDYFDNRVPTGITNATVSVTNGTQVFNFDHVEGGRYVYNPVNEGIGNIGDKFSLNIEVDDKILTSSTELYRVPEIDSISIFIETEGFGDDGYFAELYATDFPGQGDTYWVKSYRNDTLLNKPQEINLIYDSSFNPGTNLDGVTFIRPLRFAINAIGDDGLFRDINPGDRIRSEIYSISNDAFDFMRLVQEQTTNGDNSIFALPVANSRGNVRDQDGNLVLGVFNVAAVTSFEVTF
jgi:hypothetical protein